MAYRDLEKRRENRRKNDLLNPERKKENFSKWYNSGKGKEYKRKYVKEEKNRVRILETRKRWYYNNHEKIKETAREYVQKRKKEDPIYKLKTILRKRTILIFKHNGFKKGKATDMLGATFDIVKSHLEKQFTEGMNWKNHGKCHGKWNIDHIIPLVSAKTEEDLIKLCHYTNLQPLWFLDNMRKGKKMPQIL